MSNFTNQSSYFIRLSSLELVVNGVLSPFLIVLAIVTNSLVSAVLLRPHMRSKTNTILVAMAVADTLTGICPLPSHDTVPYYYYYYTTTTTNTCPLPSYLRFYTWTLLQRHSLVPDPVRVPYRWCSFYFSSIDFLPTVFHTASIWLTVYLAVQRYICVSRFQPTATGATGSQTGVVLLIVTLYVVSALKEICSFLEYRFVQF